MASHEGLGNFIINEDEIRGTTLDIFNTPEKETSFISGKEVEVRLITVLERFVKFFINLFEYCTYALQYTLKRSDFLYCLSSSLFPISSGPFEFSIPATTDYTLLPLTRLHGTCQIVHKDGTSIPDDVDFSTVNLFPHSLF